MAETDTIDLPSTEVMKLIVGWLREHRPLIDAFCDENGLPRPPHT